MNGVNEVRLAGRVSASPEARQLPSGDEILLCRLVVPRDELARAYSRQAIDVVECVAWSKRAQSIVRRWGEGDEVEVEGCLRRRFYRTGTVTVSRVEVEFRGGRLKRRSKAG